MREKLIYIIIYSSRKIKIFLYKCVNNSNINEKVKLSPETASTSVIQILTRKTLLFKFLVDIPEIIQKFERKKVNTEIRKNEKATL